MTEHCPLYHAQSGATEPLSHRSTYPDLLVQHRVDGTVCRDIILLLPILQSVQRDDSPALCMQLVHLEDGNLSFCNQKTKDLCSCCGLPVCGSHFISSWVAFPDEANESCFAPLCQTCLCLPDKVRLALRAFRQGLNEGQVQR
jgi:hypothetical protein